MIGFEALENNLTFHHIWNREKSFLNLHGFYKDDFAIIIIFNFNCGKLIITKCSYVLQHWKQEIAENGGLKLKYCITESGFLKTDEELKSAWKSAMQIKNQAFFACFICGLWDCRKTK